LFEDLKKIFWKTENQIRSGEVYELQINNTSIYISAVEIFRHGDINYVVVRESLDPPNQGYAVIAKYRGGKEVAEEEQSSLEDVCYFKQGKRLSRRLDG